MATPIYNPIIPCVHGIPGGMFPGRMLRFQGTVPHNADRFAINLQCGPNTDPRDDIALHINFRFVEMCVVRNNLVNMNWGPEDTSGGMPLVRGQPFEALVLCEAGSIKIALNGVHFCEFAHRTPPQRITHITVDGDIQLQFIGFEGPQYMGAADTGFSAPGYGAPPPAYGQTGYGQPPQGFVPRAHPTYPPSHQQVPPPPPQYMPPPPRPPPPMAYTPPVYSQPGYSQGPQPVQPPDKKKGGFMGKLKAGLLGTAVGAAGGGLVGSMLGRGHGQSRSDDHYDESGRYNPSESEQTTNPVYTEPAPPPVEPPPPEPQVETHTEPSPPQQTYSPPEEEASYDDFSQYVD